MRTAAQEGGGEVGCVSKMVVEKNREKTEKMG